MTDASPRSPWRDAWQRLARNRLAVVCGVLLAVIVALVLFGPLVMSHSQTAQQLEYGAQPPDGTHWFGTDTLGRDLMVRVLAGGRISLAVGLVATLVSLVIGVAYGAVSAYLGGKVDAVMMRLVEILYSLPFIILVILLMVVLEPMVQGEHEAQAKLIILFFAIGAIEWLTMARVVRAQVLALKKLDFVTAARAIGVPAPQIISRHLVPNALGPVIVYSTLTIPQVMLLEAALSFLGLGSQPPYASWGKLIQEGAANMESHPWMLVFPAIFFSLTLVSFNFIGDGLRDALDPKSK